ncbi:hypothetical protein GCM10023067_60270 [Aminobacter aganoensis]|uniref:2-oxoglutarate dehydrogenase E1 subunit family protein n=1 Tax=Aminobacter aganoensis TaxID=83264 RepID=UPI0031EF65E0
MTELYKQYLDTSYLSGGNAAYVEDQYEAYLQDPTSVSEALRAYFDALQNVPAVDGSNARDIPTPRSSRRLPSAPSKARSVRSWPLPTPTWPQARGRDAAGCRVPQRGPALGRPGSAKRQERPPVPDLDPAFYGFTEADQDIIFNASNTYFGKESMSLRELVNNLRETYCGSIGAEFMYISDQAQKRWWQERLESIRSKPTFSAEKKKHILERLTAAEGLERFLHTKYVGQKRFLARRWRELHRGDGRADPARRCQGRSGNRHRHGPPRPSERAGQHAGQDAG